MQIEFQKQAGHPELSIAFFWRLSLTAGRPRTVTDHFIPELFYDYFLVSAGAVGCADPARKTKFRLPAQSFKTLYTRPLTLTYRLPLVLYGARFALSFAESYWGPGLAANVFVEQTWVSPPPATLSAFAARLTELIRARQTRKTQQRPLLTPALEESAWLAAYSPRHKRRLYQSVFGVSRQALLRLSAVHAFLEQTCDFAPHMPRIIGHVNPEVFYDQPHLNRAFKQTTGLTPLEYFETPSILQDNLMAASYNAPDTALGKLEP